MNNAHLHLVVNHLPIIFPIVGVIILLIAIFTKAEVSKRNAYITFVLGAMASVLAMATGEGAEEAVEGLPGVSEALITAHEEAAEIFASLSYVLGGVALVGLLSSFKNLLINKFMPVVLLVVSAATLYFAFEAGRTGGEIRHTEIRSGTTFQNGDNGSDLENIQNSERDDD